MSARVPRSQVNITIFGNVYGVDPVRLRKKIRESLRMTTDEIQSLRRAVLEALEAGASYADLKEAVRSVTGGSSGRSGRSATGPSRARAGRAARRSS